jgi:nitroreductase
MPRRVSPRASIRPTTAVDARPAFVLVAYDFPFALHQLAATSSALSTERAKEVVCRSAGLQGQALQAAAEVSGLSMRAVSAFDVGALKTVFFPSTQETVIQLFRLELGRP